MLRFLGPRDELLTQPPVSGLFADPPADLAADGLSWARQNVTHETGFFHGRHGFRRTAVVVEKGTNLPSNFDGLQQLRYDSGQVLSAVSGIIEMIRREFPPEN